MTVFRASSLLLPALLALAATAAPTSAFATYARDRDASFMPVPEATSAPEAPPAADIAPVTLIPPPQQVQPVPAIAPVAPAPLAPTVIAPVTTTAPATTTTAVPIPAASAAPPFAAERAPASVPAPVPTTMPVPPVAEAPVESAKLADVNPDSLGLLSPAEGGLGVSLWKGTPRSIVEKLMPALNLPTASPILNNLADRMLLSTASPPDGASAPNAPSLTALRVAKLIDLGDAANAWKLAMLAKPGQLDDLTLREAAEYALVSSVADDVCARLPDVIKTHGSPEWQKSLLVCQLRANDRNAAQITLDLLHSQNVKDDIFFELVEKNIMTSGKYLPRTLTPLKPLNLALLRIIDLPLRAELYGHPEAALIPELLKTKSVEEKPRLDLAERAASHGLILPATLAEVYRSLVMQPELASGAATSKETGGRLRALLYQAAQQEKTPQNRVTLALRMLRSLSGDEANGAAAQLAAEMISDVAPSSEYAAQSDQLVLLHILAGKPEIAFNWMKIAKPSAIGMPSVAAGLRIIWPLTIPAGLQSDKEYAHDLGAWLDSMLGTDPKTDNRAARATASSVLLLLEADGFAVPEEDWARVADVTPFEKHLMPPALLMDRLRLTDALNHRGEAVLDAVSVMDPNGDTPLSTMLDIIRALRLNGLTADTANLTREAMAGLLILTGR